MSEIKLQRRTLMKGAAWATPVIAASSAIPAYAASLCIPSPRSQGGMYPIRSDWHPDRYDDNWFEYGISFGRIFVYGLKPSVTVKDVTVTRYLSYDDFRWVNNVDGRGNGGQIRISDGTWKAYNDLSHTFNFYDYKNSGLSTNTLVYKQIGAYDSTGPVGNDTPHDYTSFTNTWTAATGGRNADYLTDPSSSDCRVFVIPEMGEFAFRETRSSTLFDFDTQEYRSYDDITVNLSDGTRLHWVTWDPEATPEFGAPGYYIFPNTQV